MEAKQFGQFIAGIRKEKKMTQAELAEKIHVTDKAISRWERGLGFPDIQTLEPLAQVLGISVLELMRSEKKKPTGDMDTTETQYTQKEVAEMLQNADDISKQLKKQDKNANIIAGILVIGVGALAWATKIASLGGGLVLGGLSAAVFVSLWYFFQNIDDEESRRIYGVASILSIGILVSLVNYIWGDRIAEWIPGGIERTEQIFWTLWYLFMIAMMMVGTIRCVRRQRQKKEKKYKTVLFTGIMAAIMFATLWQYQNTMQGQRRNMGIWSGAQQYAETLLKKDKNLENDWLIGDESWRDGKNTYQVRLTYYADADAEKEGRESEYQYTIHFDEIAKEKIFHAIDCIKPSTLKELMKEGYVNLKNRLGRRPMLLDFYENAEMDPLVIIKEYKTYYSFAEQMEKNEQLFRLSEQEKTTLEYLSKTILSGVRPDELEILRLFLEKNQITYSEVIDNCRERYGYEITTQKIDLACDVLKGKFVTNSTEREKFYQIDILESDGENRLKRILSYTERLAHKDFYDQVQDIVAVGLARYQDKYAKPYRNGVPFVLYEKYSRRDVSLLMNAGKDLSSTMYGMSQLGDDVFIFVTYHKEENTDEEKEYVDGKPDYADEFVDNIIFRWDSQIDKKLDGAYMDKVLNTPRKHLFVQKTDAENNFFYMGEFDVLEAHEAEKKNNRGVLKPICKLKFKMQTAVREDLLRYLQSGKTMEEK